MLLKMFRNIVANMDIFTNVYVVADEKSLETIVIDPGGAADKISNYIENRRLKLKYIFLTHCHADHVEGLKALHNCYPNAKILVHKDDFDGMIDKTINMCEVVGVESNDRRADIALEDGDEIEFGNLVAKIIHTPGHTKGSISILINDAVFTGDTLFKRLYGRTDLATGSNEDMEHSIHTLLRLPGNTIVYPGHGAISIIREEKEYYEEIKK